MSARKSERLINLLIALLSTRRFLSKRELRDLIEDYRGLTPTAFERQFERDKDELRGLGIVIETGSNDAFFDDEEGYRINRAEFELPEIEFTAEELSALSLAAQVWQDSVAADHTAQAFEALRAAGASPDPALVPTIRPQLGSAEPDFDTVYDAVLRRVVVGFGYNGQTRRLQPWRLLQRRGHWYVFGYDLDRDGDRFFKLARFTAPATLQGKPGAFEVPEDVDQRAGRLEPSYETSAILALRTDSAHAFDTTEPVEWDAVPAGFRACRVRFATEQAVVSEVAAAGPDAILLDPPHLRARVIKHLEGVVRP